MSFCDMQKLFFSYFLTTISISGAPHLLHDSWKYAKIMKMCTNDNICLAI